MIQVLTRILCKHCQGSGFIRHDPPLPQLPRVELEDQWNFRYPGAPPLKKIVYYPQPPLYISGCPRCNGKGGIEKWITKEEFMKQAVRIEKNPDGTYSAYIYDTCYHNGTYEECVQALRWQGEEI